MPDILANGLVARQGALSASFRCLRVERATDVCLVEIEEATMS